MVNLEDVIDLDEQNKRNCEAMKNAIDFMVKETIRVCPHCKKPVVKSQLPQYEWQCKECDEDFFDFECL